MTGDEADPVLAWFSKRIHHERKRRGWPMREFAAKAGLSLGSAHRTEHGSDVQLTAAVRIADALEIPLGELLTEPACPACYDRPPDGYVCSHCGAQNEAATRG